MNQIGLFQKELQEEKKERTKLARQNRSLKLIANFNEGGYAEGWYFAVGEFFRNELDIKQTERVDPETKRKRLVWTQGPYYCFDEGHIIYDTPKAYSQWKKALKYIKFHCEVLRAKPCGFIDGSFSKGQVTLKISKPDKGKTRLESIDQFHLSQNDFVGFLKTGLIDGKHIEDF